MTEISDRLRAAFALRKKRHVDIAAEMKCSGTAVTYWANGKHQPSVAQLQAMATFLAVDPVWLVFGTGEMTPREINQRDRSSATSSPS